VGPSANKTLGGKFAAYWLLRNGVNYALASNGEVSRDLSAKKKDNKDSNDLEGETRSSDGGGVLQSKVFAEEGNAHKLRTEEATKIHNFHRNEGESDERPRVSLRKKLLSRSEKIIHRLGSHRRWEKLGAKKGLQSPTRTGSTGKSV